MNLYVGYADTCRVCLKKDEKSNLSIFDSLNETIKYSDILTMVLHPIPIDMNPRLPQKLCQLCKENLIKMHNLRQLCFTSDRWIKSTLYGDVYLNANGFVVDGVPDPNVSNVETMIIDSDAEENEPPPIPSFFLSQFQFDTPEVILQENIDSELQISEMVTEKELDAIGKPVKEKRKCELCRRKFATVGGYIRHQLKKHNIQHKNELNTNGAEAEIETANEPEKEQFDCEICHRKFTTLKGRIRHMAIHKNVLSGGEDNSAQDANFHNESSKDIEMMPELPHVENYRCQKCSTGFTCLQEYSKHMLRHMVVRLDISDNRMCQQCGLSYSTLRNLKRHQMQANHKNIVK